uniref:Uncharacterized protein n=1 Tax=Bicosoecida sp. CB-2014 TaxID=1486930 RepID=A0A6T6Y492_9STRA|mmetsp:Transcript_3126/g.11189  ORF Transcript_3126/g.11189 Transcript_3126/m.11189 type:complete len:139 (+) Transcript_3126:230-646(+)
MFAKRRVDGNKRKLLQTGGWERFQNRLRTEPRLSRTASKAEVQHWLATVMRGLLHPLAPVFRAFDGPDMYGLAQADLRAMCKLCPTDSQFAPEVYADEKACEKRYLWLWNLLYRSAEEKAALREPFYALLRRVPTPPP